MSDEVVLLIVGAAAAGLVQGISGFAFSMVAMSFWVWGIEPRVAAAMAVFGSLAGQLLSALTVRRQLAASTLIPFLAGGAVGIPLGVFALPYFDAALFKLTIGSMLLFCCPALLLAAQVPRITAGGRLADALAGALGGAMGGLGGFTGVAPSLWCTLRGYDKELQRSIIQNFNLAMLSVTMVSYVLAGAVTPDMLPKFAIVLAALVVPSVLGARIYLGIGPLAFRRVVLGVLFIAGGVMVCASLPALIGRL